MSRYFLPVAALAACAAPVSAATVETFETLGPKDVLLPTVLSPIGIFNPAPGGAGNLVISSPGYTNYGAGNNPTTTSILTANGDESFEFLLAAPASAVFMDVYLNDLGPATLTYFNGATQIGQLGFVADANATNNFLAQVGFDFGDSNQITRITFLSTLGGQLNTGLDNVTVTFVGEVPEPSAWSLMIAGFGLVGGAMRARSKRRGLSQLA